MSAFRTIYAKGGWRAFYRGMQPKMVESFLKGGILLYAKEAAIKVLIGAGISEAPAGLMGGFVGGVAQVVVMGPCTFLVTAAVTGDKSTSMITRISQTFAKNGVAGFYRGGTALIFRQGTNWASRQGITDYIRSIILKMSQSSDPSKKKLNTVEECAAGIIGECPRLPFVAQSCTS